MRCCYIIYFYISCTLHVYIQFLTAASKAYCSFSKAQYWLYWLESLHCPGTAHTNAIIIAIYYVYMALLTLFSFSFVYILSLYLHMYVCTLYLIMFSSFSVLSSFCNPMTPLSTFWFLHEHGSLQIFNRILKSFQLPVGPKEYYGEKINKKVFLSPQKAASFIISMMVITSCPCLKVQR